MKPHSTLGFALSAAVLCVSCSTTDKKSVVVLTTGAARNVMRLTQTPQDETNPAVSPDGKTLAFQVSKGNQHDIWTMDTSSGRNLIQATSHPMQDLQPGWMPESKSLVFTSDSLGSFALWRIKTSAQNQVA